MVNISDVSTLALSLALVTAAACGGGESPADASHSSLGGASGASGTGTDASGSAGTASAKGGGPGAGAGKGGMGGTSAKGGGGNAPGGGGNAPGGGTGGMGGTGGTGGTGGKSGSGGQSGQSGTAGTAAAGATAGGGGSSGSPSSVPTPESIAGKTVVGRIDLTDAAGSGQTIQNVHVVNHDGPCIVLNNVHDVTILNSEIGPCGDASNQLGDVGIKIVGGSTRITVRQNVIHDASDLISGDDVRGPVSVDRNLFYNIRGTSYEASAIQLGESRTHSGPITITCNVIDDRLVAGHPMAGARQRRSEDHISMYNSGGTAAYPLEIAFNRIRGALDGWGGISGSGMQLGDSPAGGGNPGSNTPGFIYTHHNIVYWTNGSGISYAGGAEGNRVEYNMVDNRGTGPGPSNTVGGSQILGKGTSDTGWHYGLRKYDVATTMDIAYKGNLGVASLWAYNNDGQLAGSASSVFGAAGVVVHDLGGNDFQHAGFGTTLGVDTIWDLPVMDPCL